jgi:small subunit ribosomal protein S21
VPGRFCPYPADIREIRPSSRSRGPKEVSVIVQVVVRDNNVDQALKALKKKMQREGVFREMKLRRSYEKPSEKRARERAEAIRRGRKLARKRKEREGY